MQKKCVRLLPMKRMTIFIAGSAIPNVKEFTDRMCILEGAEDGYATASGMSAVFASFMTFLKKGDHLISCNAIFGSTHTIITKYLPNFGIEYTYVPAVRS